MLTNVSGVSPDIGGPSGVLRGSDPKKNREIIYHPDNDQWRRFTSQADITLYRLTNDPWFNSLKIEQL